MNKWKAHDIQWDVDSPEVLATLPIEIVIPPDVAEDDIADFISDQTGFCHKGFQLKRVSACRCGCDRFYAHQACRLSVVVNSDNFFVENVGGNAEAAIYDVKDPYGPYQCVECGAEYDSLEDLSEAEENIFAGKEVS